MKFIANYVKKKKKKKRKEVEIKCFYINISFTGLYLLCTLKMVDYKGKMY